MGLFECFAHGWSRCVVPSWSPASIGYGRPGSVSCTGGDRWACRHQKRRAVPSCSAFPEPLGVLQSTIHAGNCRLPPPSCVTSAQARWKQTNNPSCRRAVPAMPGVPGIRSRQRSLSSSRTSIFGHYIHGSAQRLVPKWFQGWMSLAVTQLIWHACERDPTRSPIRADQPARPGPGRSRPACSQLPAGLPRERVMGSGGVEADFPDGRDPAHTATGDMSMRGMQWRSSARVDRWAAISGSGVTGYAWRASP